MKIGIVTFYKACNYGAVLQAFALQTFLRNQGHTPYFIANHFGFQTGLRAYIGKTPSMTISKWAAIRRYAAFTEFIQSRFSCIHVEHEEESPGTSSCRCDAYICGSDQIWNPRYLQTRGDEKLFFLDFGPPSTRRIAYAASIGVNAFSHDYSARVQLYLSRFDHISVREMNAVDVLGKLTSKSIQWVPDPTLLLCPSDYINAFGIERHANDNVIAYMIGKYQQTGAIAQAKQCVSNKLMMPIQNLYERRRLLVLLHEAYTPERWLQALAYAPFVLTDSFHATVFALRFHRPFIVLPLTGQMAGMNSRITSLLGFLGLESRFVKQVDQRSIDRVCDAPINWNDVDKKLDRFAKTGVSFLETALR